MAKQSKAQKVNTKAKHKHKPLNAKELIKQDKNLDNWEEIIIDKNDYGVELGDSYILKVNQTIRESIINQFMKDMLIGINYYAEERDKNNLEESSEEEFIFNYNIVLLLKHFTTLGLSFPEKVEEQLYVLRILIDKKVLGQIMNKIPSDVIVQITNKINAITDSLDDTEEKMITNVLKSQEEQFKGQPEQQPEEQSEQQPEEQPEEQQKQEQEQDTPIKQ